MPTRLGRLLRTTRELRGIGLREMARLVSKSPAFIVALELHDEIPSVKEETLVEIAKALGLEPDKVLALAKKTPDAVTPETELEIRLYRAIKRLSKDDKEALLKKLGGAVKPNKTFSV